jgi:hypothetical protein
MTWPRVERGLSACIDQWYQFKTCRCTPRATRSSPYKFEPGFSWCGIKLGFNISDKFILVMCSHEPSSFKLMKEKEKKNSRLDHEWPDPESNGDSACIEECYFMACRCTPRATRTSPYIFELWFSWCGIKLGFSIQEAHPWPTAVTST